MVDSGSGSFFSWSLFFLEPPFFSWSMACFLSFFLLQSCFFFLAKSVFSFFLDFFYFYLVENVFVILFLLKSYINLTSDFFQEHALTRRLLRLAGTARPPQRARPPSPGTAAGTGWLATAATLRRPVPSRPCSPPPSSAAAPPGSSGWSPIAWQHGPKVQGQHGHLLVIGERGFQRCCGRRCLVREGIRLQVRWLSLHVILACKWFLMKNTFSFDHKQYKKHCLNSLFGLKTSSQKMSWWVGLNYFLEKETCRFEVKLKSIF